MQLINDYRDEVVNLGQAGGVTAVGWRSSSSGREYLVPLNFKKALPRWYRLADLDVNADVGEIWRGLPPSKKNNQLSTEI